MLTLDNARPGARLRIVSVDGRGWVQRLYQMGLLPGSIVEVVSNYGVGPVVLRVMGVEVAIGRGIARRIYVEEVKES
ncbi:ferrous iron transport protein A [Thermogladius sp. KZ2Tp1]|uniref:FeoA family protein n=1 Tax=Thermogladius sp. KZ2Tp1 TaxID=3136289 RepID=UPI003DA812F7